VESTKEISTLAVRKMTLPARRGAANKEENKKAESKRSLLNALGPTLRIGMDDGGIADPDNPDLVRPDIHPPLQHPQLTVDVRLTITHVTGITQVPQWGVLLQMHTVNPEGG
jgi:hypothetical protein